MIRWIGALLIAVAVAGCTTESIKPIVTNTPVTVSVPASLKQRCSIPRPPAPSATQRDVAIGLARVYRALEDCQARHSALVGVIENFRRQVEAQQNRAPGA